MSTVNYRDLTINGLWKNNPGLVQLLGLCPLLGVSNSTVNALGLGLATMLVLTCSNLAVSLVRGVVNTAATVTNTNCTISGTGFTVTGTGNTLTLPVTFKPAYAGARNIYVSASDAAGANTGWITAATWTVI